MKDATYQAFCEHAIREFPKEACGLVVVSGRKEQFVPCRNVADDPLLDFAIHKCDQAYAEDLGIITMVIHSHPNASARPSESDMRGCENSGLPWCIVAVHGDPAQPKASPVVMNRHEFAPTGYVAPLRGRQFIFGQQDCYTLVQDYYERELGIMLPHFERRDKFWERGENLYMENLEKSGFKLIDEPSEKGDLILMAIRSDVVNHAAVWLGDMNYILHHPYQHLSEKTVYGGYWADNTRYFARMNK